MGTQLIVNELRPFFSFSFFNPFVSANYRSRLHVSGGMLTAVSFVADWNRQS
jgi:hypothetical protein